MSPRRNAGEKPDDGEANTLGAVLYSDGTQTPIAEGEWVELVHSVAAGDALALHALYQRTYRIVFTLIMRITNHKEMAEELTLDVFHDVWRRAASYDPEAGTVIGWIMNQARSRAIDRLRFEQREKRNNPYPGQSPAKDAALDVSVVHEQREQAQRLRDAMQLLTSDERAAIETTFFSDLTHLEAAERLDQPLGTLKTRIRSGLAKLRKALAMKGTI